MSSHPVVPHEHVGEFRLISRIRAGKSCEVWEVAHETTGARLAIKRLVGDPARHRDEVALLKHEHQVGHALDHPRVIKIHDFVGDDHIAFLTLELFAFPNVKQWIHQGVETFAPFVTDAIRNAAAGLAYFHTQDWIHGDIKPDNFLLQAGGAVKLIDFALAVRPKRGLVRLLAARPKIQGTRSYLSPEQIQGEVMDQRSDIYSFGCMVHEMVGGKPPYFAPHPNDLLAKHLHAPIPHLPAANHNVTDGFAILVKRMLAKRPEDRPQTMTEVCEALEYTRVFKYPPSQVANPAPPSPGLGD